MVPASSPLPPDFAAAYNGALARAPAIRLDLRWYPSAPSTMDLAADAVQARAPEGLVICADEQTAGRGRRGRQWSSPPGAGLYLSIVLRPAHDPAGDNRVVSLITLAAGLAVRDAIARACGLTCDLKWPNDVTIGRRKVAGILAEGFDIDSPDQAVVVGIGINMLRAVYPRDVEARAVALEEQLGRAVDRALLLEETLVALAAWYDRLRRGSASDILQDWRRAAPAAVGASVEWAETGRRGVTAGIDGTGALLIETDTGIERVVAGELRWL